MKHQDDRLICVGYLDAAHVAPLFVERHPIGAHLSDEERRARVRAAWRNARAVVRIEASRLRLEALNVLAAALNLGTIPERLAEVTRQLGEEVGVDADAVERVTQEIREGIRAYVTAKTTGQRVFDERGMPGQRPTRPRSEVWGS